MEPAKENELQLMAAAVARIEASVQTIVARSNALRDDNTSLRAQVSISEKKLTAAEQQVRQISETANALQKKNEETKRRCEELEHQVKLHATDLERTRMMVQTREAESQGLTDALADSQRETERLRGESEILREEKNEALRAVESMEHESGSYATMLAQRDNVIAAREEEINQLAMQVEQGAAQIVELKQTLEHSRTELASLGETNGSADGMPLFSHEERDQMTNKIKELVGKLDRYLA